MTVTAQNFDHSADEAVAAVTAPSRADGSVYRYEMLYAGMTRRAYADDPTALLDVLLPGYSSQDDDEQWVARLNLAARAQVLAQAVLNSAESFQQVTPQQREILSGTRHEPPVVPAWDCVVPLVLIASYYLPAGKIPRPKVAEGMGPNLIWIDPSDDLSLLESLHDVGAIALHEAGE